MEKKRKNYWDQRNWPGPEDRSLPSLGQTQADPLSGGSSQCWQAGMYLRASQSPQSISLTTKKRSAQGMVPPHGRTAASCRAPHGHD